MAQQLEKSVSAKLANISFVCSVLVVCIHIDWVGYGGLANRFFDAFIKNGVSQLAVPFFFLASGYFLAAHFNEKGWWRREMLKRVHSLLVPYLIWLTVSFALLSILGIISDVVAHRAFGTSVYFSNGRWIRTFGFDFTTHPGLTPLWYLRSLMMMVLIAPVLKYATGKLGVLWLTALLLVSVCIKGMDFGSAVNGFLYYGFSVTGMLYFSVGIYLRTHLRSQNFWMTFILCLEGVVLAVCANCIFSAERGIVVASIVPLMLVAMWRTIRDRPLPNGLSSCAFPIFLIHCIVLNYCDVFCKVVGFVNPATPYIMILLGVAFPCLCEILLRNRFANIHKLLFGGR